jgi:hypothetical protein
MRKTASIVVLAGLALASTSCYESVEPLGKPGERLDQALFGDWNCVPAEAKPGDEPLVVHIWRFDPFQYLVETVEDADRIDRYQVYPSRIGGRTLLNLRDIEKKGEDRWIFLRYALDGRDRFTFWVIPEEALKGIDPGQAMATIRRRAGDDAFYKRVADCRRR